MSGSYGIVQWTPATNIIDWAKAQGLDYRECEHAVRPPRKRPTMAKQCIKPGTTFWNWLKV